MGPKYEHFKFELGQIVQQRINAESDGRRMFIMERMVQECPGGVQLNYKCRPQRECPQSFLENELEDYKPDNVMSSAEVEAMLLARAVRRKQREAELGAKTTRVATESPDLVNPHSDLPPANDAGPVI